jgi:hypothetical protein
MRRLCPLVVLLIALELPGPVVRAETSLDVLNNELEQAREDHASASSKQFTDLMSALDQALQSPEQALQLYQNAGGEMPDFAPVMSSHSSETPDEKELREAQDEAVDAALVSLIQLHCGVMRYAALFIQTPDQRGLHDEWVAWLKQAAQIYPQAGLTPHDTRTRVERNRNVIGQDPPPPPPKAQDPFLPGYARALKDASVRDSVISNYYGYKGWGDKEQGGWAVHDIPRLFRTEILDRLRTNPSAATIAAWDTYIAMRKVDAGDPNKWNNVEYPELEFQRGCDNYYAKPGEEKLEVLVDLVKNNPTNPSLDKWITQVKQLIQDYRNLKSSGTTPPPADSSTSGPYVIPDTTSTTSTPAPAPIPDNTTQTPAPAPPAAPNPIPPAPTPAPDTNSAPAPAAPVPSGT